jgi:hypothetical protein
MIRIHRRLLNISFFLFLIPITFPHACIISLLHSPKLCDVQTHTHMRTRTHSQTDHCGARPERTAGPHVADPALLGQDRRGTPGNFNFNSNFDDTTRRLAQSQLLLKFVIEMITFRVIACWRIRCTRPNSTTYDMVPLDLHWLLYFKSMTEQFVTFSVVLLLNILIDWWMSDVTLAFPCFQQPIWPFGFAITAFCLIPFPDDMQWHP